MRLFQITGIFSLFLIVLCSFHTTDFRNDDKNYHIQIDEVHFEITFPVEKIHVKELTDFQEVDGKVIKVYNYAATMQGTSDENLSYQVVAHKLYDINTNQEIEQLFDDARDRVIDDLRTKMDSVTTVTIESEEKISLNGVYGRSWSVRIKHPEMIKDIVWYNRFFCTKDCLYKVMVMHRNSNFPNKSGSKFFDSFKILDK